MIVEIEVLGLIDNIKSLLVTLLYLFLSESLSLLASSKREGENTSTSKEGSVQNHPPPLTSCPTHANNATPKLESQLLNSFNFDAIFDKIKQQHGQQQQPPAAPLTIPNSIIHHGKNSNSLQLPSSKHHQEK